MNAVHAVKQVQLVQLMLLWTLAHCLRLVVLCCSLRDRVLPTHSVTKQEIVDAIYQQTGRNLADAEMVVPEIKAVGTFECSVKLVRATGFMCHSLNQG